jgi:hypothetical protein
MVVSLDEFSEVGEIKCEMLETDGKEGTLLVAIEYYIIVNK